MLSNKGRLKQSVKMPISLMKEDLFLILLYRLTRDVSSVSAHGVTTAGPRLEVAKADDVLYMLVPMPFLALNWVPRIDTSKLIRLNSTTLFFLISSDTIIHILD